MLILSGILVIVIGFALRLNPLGVVTVAGLVTGVAAGMTPLAVIAAFGKAFNESRYVSAIWILLPVIGLLERYGLQERARALIAGMSKATPGRLLTAYLLFRQVTAAVGLNAIAGPAQTVRPLVAPMAEAAAERSGPLSAAQRQRVRAMAAATDNVGLLFAEDVFIAIASILLIKGFLAVNGIVVTPFGPVDMGHPHRDRGVRRPRVAAAAVRPELATVIGLGTLYAFAGLVFAGFAVLSGRDRTNPRRFGNAAFWGLMALSFLAGDRLGDLGNGCLALALALLAATGQLGRGSGTTTTAETRGVLAAKYGNNLFAAALIVPATALVGTLAFARTRLVDPKQVTLVALGLGVVVALAVCYRWLRPSLLAPLEEGRRLIDSVGWAAVLPQALAALGAVFALAGVGTVVGDLVGGVPPHDNRLAAVAAYTLGMAGFTMIMGNAFAAFPVMTAAIGLPLLVHGLGGDPAAVCAIGMLSGFCGTLMTPMAANFNIVPATLLELDDRNGVIKAQIGTALPLLVLNTLLMYWLAFP